MKIKKPCPEHYMLGQISNGEFARRYGEDEDENGLTPSERYKLQYAERFVFGKRKIKVDKENKEWAELLKESAIKIGEHLKKKRIAFA